MTQAAQGYTTGRLFVQLTENSFSFLDLAPEEVVAYNQMSNAAQVKFIEAQLKRTPPRDTH